MPDRMSSSLLTITRLPWHNTHTEPAPGFWVHLNGKILSWNRVIMLITEGVIKYNSSSCSQFWPSMFNEDNVELIVYIFNDALPHTVSVQDWLMKNSLTTPECWKDPLTPQQRVWTKRSHLFSFGTTLKEKFDLGLNAQNPDPDDLESC